MGDIAADSTCLPSCMYTVYITYVLCTMVHTVENPTLMFDRNANKLAYHLGVIGVPVA